MSSHESSIFSNLKIDLWLVHCFVLPVPFTVKHQTCMVYHCQSTVYPIWAHTLGLGAGLIGLNCYSKVTGFKTLEIQF